MLIEDEKGEENEDIKIEEREGRKNENVKENERGIRIKGNNID